MVSSQVNFLTPQFVSCLVNLCFVNNREKNIPPVEETVPLLTATFSTSLRAMWVDKMN